ncbi:MAG: alpha/beta fold hydrolase [Acidobacteriota bacterium]
MQTFVRIAAAVWLLLTVAQAQTLYQPKLAEPVTGTMFDRYVTRDKLGREITFYLSRSTAQTGKLPLLVFVQGSGCISHFTKRGDRIYGGIQNLLLPLAQGRARVLVVEKPGVSFLEQNEALGTALKCTPEFLAEHTLERWAEAVGAGIKAAHELPDIERGKTLVAGHSEGGIIAARVAAENAAITHVASLAGGGPTQLFDLVEFARQNPPPQPAGSPDAGTTDPGQRIYDAWQQIQADPDSTEKFFMAHPYRRWSSFMKSSVAEELLKSRAKIYLAQGTQDKAVVVTGFDVLRAQLVTKGRDVRVERIAGGDHGFARNGEDRDALRRVLSNVVNWFFETETKP